MRKITKKTGLLSLLFALVLTSCASGPQVKEGKIVKLDYTGYLDNGEQFDSSLGKNPLTFVVGSGQVLPAFEKAITGLRVGTKKKFTLKAEDAYGLRDEAKVTKVKRDAKRFPPSLEIKKDAFLMVNQRNPENGQMVQFPVKVLEFSDKEVTLDYNHPLAGENLSYEIEIIEVVEDATELLSEGAEDAAQTEAPKQEETAKKG